MEELSPFGAPVAQYRKIPVRGKLARLAGVSLSLQPSDVGFLERYGVGSGQCLERIGFAGGALRRPGRVGSEAPGVGAGADSSIDRVIAGPVQHRHVRARRHRTSPITQPLSPTGSSIAPKRSCSGPGVATSSGHGATVSASCAAASGAGVAEQRREAVRRRQWAAQPLFPRAASSKT